MKKILFVIAIGLIVLTGCTGVKTLSTGLENEAFIEFIGKPSNYSGGVDVNIDDKTTFKAEVTKTTQTVLRAKSMLYPQGHIWLQ